MEASFFTPRPYIENAEPGEYALPEPKERRGTFWQFLQPVLGYEPERYPAATGEVDWQLDAVARRDRRMAEVNAPPGPVAAVIAEVADVVTTAVKKLRKPTELQRAKAWLQEMLNAGPMAQREVEKLARKEGITARTLKRAKQALRVKSTGKPKQPWMWSLLRAKAKEDSGPGE